MRRDFATVSKLGIVCPTWWWATCTRLFLLVMLQNWNYLSRKGQEIIQVDPVQTGWLLIVVASPVIFLFYNRRTIPSCSYWYLKQWIQRVAEKCRSHVRKHAWSVFIEMLTTGHSEHDRLSNPRLTSSSGWLLPLWFATWAVWWATTIYLSCVCFPDELGQVKSFKRLWLCSLMVLDTKSYGRWEVETGEKGWWTIQPSWQR